MARNKNRDSGENTAADEPTGENVNDTNSGQETQNAVAKDDKRHIYVTRPDTGEKVRRAEYIRELAASGKSRAEITKHIREITNDPDFRYQIVFQATKDMENLTPSARGKKKEGEAASGETAGAEGDSPVAA